MTGITWNVGMTLESVEKEVILQALRHFRGNQTITAQAIGITPRTLGDKLKRYKEDGGTAEERAERVRKQQAEWAYRERYGHNGKAGKSHEPIREAYEFGEGNAEPGVTEPTESNAVELGKSQFGSGEGEGTGLTANSDGAETGLRVEPAESVSAQPTVPVPKREEVQGLPPRKITPSASKGTR